LDFAVAIEEAAPTCIEGLVVFHDDDSFFDRIERGTASLKYSPTGCHGMANAL
jgi:hypothetical protein